MSNASEAVPSITRKQARTAHLATVRRIRHAPLHEILTRNNNSQQ